MEQLIKKETISSLEISELTGKSHNDLLKAIRKMEQSWVKLGQGNFAQSSYFNQQQKKQPMFKLTKSECLYIATKFNDEARAKLILRWEELEKQNQHQIPTTFAEALRLAAKQSEELEQRTLQLNQAKETIEKKQT